MVGASIKFRNYKCFKRDFTGLDNIKSFNVLIGRNNCGKSSLLDLLNFLCDKKQRPTLGASEIAFCRSIPREVLERVFPEDASGGGIPGTNWWEFGKNYIDAMISIVIGQGSNRFIGITPPFTQGNLSHHAQDLARRVVPPFEGKEFFRLHAERDVLPESLSDIKTGVKPNGSGATNMIAQFINRADLDSRLVEVELLNTLNEVMRSDTIFDRITIQQNNNGSWEIYLDEKTKGRIPLSKSGSGLKTIILVLIYTILLPVVSRTSLTEVVFGFEELENNLHPALQRRLFSYLRRLIEESDTTVFATTHSNVVIDLFSKDSRVQLYHVTHDGAEANVRPVTTYVERNGINDDLDVRASDLLQSNGIIWVEGPSDRVYLNRWIEIKSGGQIEEGAHYQIIFYGGRLLSHLTAEIENDGSGELIRIFLTNRNCAIVIDSDMKAAGDTINQTKTRIQEEMKANERFCWITGGREIENYIPGNAIAQKYNASTTINNVGQYDSFADYLEKVQSGEGVKYQQKKHLFAEHVRPLLNLADLDQTLDWSDKMVALVAHIKSWNSIE
jgi:energy-coupling factor transporter ATP-binding protein EcfA2